MKPWCLTVTLGLSLAAACSDSGSGAGSGGRGGKAGRAGSTGGAGGKAGGRAGGDGQVSAGSGGKTAGGQAGEPNPGGASGQAGEAATGGEPEGGRETTGPGGMSGGGEGGEANGPSCGNGTCEAGEDCVSCASDCPCSCDHFFEEGAYPHIKALLKFQTQPTGVDYSFDSIKTAYAAWNPQASSIPNLPDFRTELCGAWDWLASSDRFTNLGQATTALNPNGAPSADDPQGRPDYFVPIADGWRLYTQWVAHNIALELRHNLPWSLEQLAETNPDAASALLDSTEMMHLVPEQGEEIGHPYFLYDGQPFSSSLGQTIIGMPRYTFRFLAQTGLVKATEHETAVALLEWARENLVHFVGSITRENCEATWGVPTPPTVEMLIEGTTSTVALPSTLSAFQHWTLGCSGTSQFVKDVLRAVNIPARVPFMCGHAQLWLPGLDLWMDHGDDPYDRNFSESMCSADFLLSDRAVFQAAFGSTLQTVYQGGVCDANPVGARVLPESVATCPIAP